jgi:hypothetical protein
MSLGFPGTSGHHYKLEAYVWSSCGAFLLGAARSDAYDDQYINYNSIRVDRIDYACVAKGTSIALADGGVLPVEKIRPGMLLASYDLDTGTVVVASAESVVASTVHVVENINDGMIVMTPCNQPVYARNETFEGWVQNAADLYCGWEIFSPTTGTWVVITSMELEYGRFRVYDLDVGIPDNFIANGLLLHNKPRPI